MIEFTVEDIDNAIKSLDNVPFSESSQWVDNFCSSGGYP